jgi:hypothetical protein
MSEPVIDFVVALLRRGVSIPDLEVAVTVGRAATPTQGESAALRRYAETLVRRLTDP